MRHVRFLAAAFLAAATRASAQAATPAGVQVTSPTTGPCAGVSNVVKIDSTTDYDDKRRMNVRTYTCKALEVRAVASKEAPVKRSADKDKSVKTALAPAPVLATRPDTQYVEYKFTFEFPAPPQIPQIQRVEESHGHLLRNTLIGGTVAAALLAGYCEFIRKDKCFGNDIHLSSCSISGSTSETCSNQSANKWALPERRVAMLRPRMLPIWSFHLGR
ncbi:hypothetical protein KW790_00050 [Candidatus Parcubacteria bacterium]|nr:hypothetical protein [Candidatus Parcubacteria bacterium]